MRLVFKLAKIQDVVGQTFDVYDAEKNNNVGVFQYHKMPEYLRLIGVVIEIDRLYVKKKYQRKGIGTFVVKSIFEKYNPKIIIACCLSVPFWQKLGFKYMQDKWGLGYYECKKVDFFKKQKEKELSLKKIKKDYKVKPNYQRLMTMQYFGDMCEDMLIDIVGNQLNINHYNKLIGSSTEEKVKNLKRYWEIKKQL